MTDIDKTELMGLSVSFCGHWLRSPLVLASGTWGETAEQLVNAVNQGCGGVTTKSCGTEPTDGHNEPNLLNWSHGLINAIGLRSRGVNVMCHTIMETVEQTPKNGNILIASVFGDEYTVVRAARRVEKADPDLIELNLSCPNRDGVMLCEGPAIVSDVTARVVGDVRTPVVVKLAPNVPDIGAVAAAAVEAGASAICAINTMPGMVVNVHNGRPTLSNGSGGISGAALKPIALKAVWDVRAACPDIPIIGTGGVWNGDDVIDMMSVGADVVGLGSVMLLRGPNAVAQIAQELWDRLRRDGLKLSDVHNRAH